jgi:hypothetical protein
VNQSRASLGTDHGTIIRISYLVVNGPKDKISPDVGNGYMNNRKVALLFASVERRNMVERCGELVKQWKVYEEIKKFGHSHGSTNRMEFAVRVF